MHLGAICHPILGLNSWRDAQKTMRNINPNLRIREKLRTQFIANISNLCSHVPLPYAVPCHDDVIKWKFFPCYWPFVLGMHRSSVNSPRKGQWRGAFVFSLICAWINGWVNNREAGDLRRHHAHYDVNVMMPCNEYSVHNCQPQRFVQFKFILYVRLKFICAQTIT